MRAMYDAGSMAIVNGAAGNSAPFFFGPARKRYARNGTGKLPFTFLPFFPIISFP